MASAERSGRPDPPRGDTGVSSLPSTTPAPASLTGLLKGLPIDEVEIDKSLALHLTSERDESGIVRAGTDLGPDLGLRVVAEGVADAADAAAR